MYFKEGVLFMEKETALENELCRLRKGDIVPNASIQRLRGTMQAETQAKGYIQLAGAVGYAYTLDLHLEPLYRTFCGHKGQWRYYGLCFKYGTVDQSRR